MQFVRFCENRFQEMKVKEATTESQEEGRIDVWADAEMKSLHFLLTFYRAVLKWIVTPKLLVMYALCTLGIIRKPEPVILNQIKAQREADKVTKAMLAAKEAEKTVVSPTA